MIDYNRKLSNVRKTQVASQRMSILILLYKKSKASRHARRRTCFSDGPVSVTF